MIVSFLLCTIEKIETHCQHSVTYRQHLVISGDIKTFEAEDSGDKDRLANIRAP